MALRTPPGFSTEHGLVEDMSGEYEPHGVEGDTPEHVAEWRGETFSFPTSSTPGQALPEQVPQPQIVAVALATFGLSPLLGAALVRTLGCTESDGAEALADLPEAELSNITQEILVGDELRPPTFFEKGAVHTFFKKLRASCLPTPVAPA